MGNQKFPLLSEAARWDSCASAKRCRSMASLL